MTWKSYHQRGEVLATAIATANARLDGSIPMDVAGVGDTFRDELDLVGALQLRWHTRLSGRIDRALAAEPMDLDQIVIDAWAETARELPGVRLVLDRALAEGINPEADVLLSNAIAKERMMLASMAGRSSYDNDAAVLVGTSLEERARAVFATAPVAEHDDARRGGLFDRLKAALAA